MTDTKEKRSLTYRLRSDLARQIRIFASANDTNASAVVSKACEEYLSKKDRQQTRSAVSA